MIRALERAQRQREIDEQYQWIMDGFEPLAVSNESILMHPEFIYMQPQEHTSN